MFKKKTNLPYRLQFKAVDIPIALGLSFASFSLYMLSRNPSMDELEGLPFTYLVLAIAPFITIFSLWHPFFVTPLFVILFVFVLPLQGRVLKTLLMALLFVTWGLYGMFCASQAMNIGF